MAGKWGDAMGVRREPFSIFISYARPDASYAQAGYQLLKSAGLNPWLDTESLRPGEEWELAIEEAIKRARVVLVLMSPRSVMRNGFLQREIREALDIWKQKAPGEIYLVPARIEPCDKHARLTRLHWIDLFTDSDWRRFTQQLQELKNAARVRRTSPTI